jgi:hypothetical protein
LAALFEATGAVAHVVAAVKGEMKRHQFSPLNFLKKLTIEGGKQQHAP